MRIQKLGGLLLVAILVAAFLPNANAAPMIAEDSDTDMAGGGTNAEIDRLEIDDDANTLYFDIIIVGLNPAVLTPTWYCFDMVNAEINPPWSVFRVWATGYVFAGVFILDAGTTPNWGVDFSANAGANWNMQQPGTIGFLVTYISPDIIRIQLDKAGVALSYGVDTKSNLETIFATTGAAHPGPTGPTPSPPTAGYYDRAPDVGGIPEFSTLLIPIIGTIALFAVFRKYRKK